MAQFDPDTGSPALPGDSLPMASATRVTTAPTAEQPLDIWAESHDDFVLALLSELRRSNYHPAAWVRFLGRSWEQSRATARAHPRLVASWAWTVAGLALGQAAALDLEARLGAWTEAGQGTGTRHPSQYLRLVAPRSPARSTALRALPGSLGLLGVVAFDVYAHLGMNARTRGEPLDPRLGVPNTLTLVRRTISALLWGHLLARRAAPRGLLLGALVVAGGTDVGDGAMARATGHQTRLGAYLDAEADYELWAGLALNLGASRRLPRWFVALLLARFSLPFVVALASYVGWVNRVAIGSTKIGKAAGVAQALTCCAALLPARPPEHTRSGWHLLFGATAALLVVAPLMQLRHVRSQKGH